jgi:hypothetical protein
MNVNIDENNLHIIRINDENTYLTISASSQKSLVLIKNYFNNHTLLSSKRLNYLD